MIESKSVLLWILIGDHGFGDVLHSWTPTMNTFCPIPSYRTVSVLVILHLRTIVRRKLELLSTSVHAIV